MNEVKHNIVEISKYDSFAKEAHAKAMQSILFSVLSKSLFILDSVYIVACNELDALFWLPLFISSDLYFRKKYKDFMHDEEYYSQKSIKLQRDFYNN